MSIYRNKNKTESGFTLVELLVVIAIIGMLAALVSLALSNARSKARDGKRKADISQIKKAIEYYYINNGTYPQAGCSDCGGSWAALSTLLVPTYLAKLPDDPKPGGTNYDYVWGSSGQSYGLLIPFGNDNNLATCRYKTANGNSSWWFVPDCTYTQ